jgi:CubicO group peptidase (beta-lactamase class C family)
VEKEAIGLDDDVGQLVPELSNKEILSGFHKDGAPILTRSKKALTLRYSSVPTPTSFDIAELSYRKLLTHSSGFCYDRLDPNIVRWSAYVGRTIDSQSDTVESFNFPLLFEPGNGWVYGVGTDWAGRVVEALSDITLEEYMQRHIFVPLGMSSTTFYISKRPDLASRRAAIGFRSSPNAPLASGADTAPKDPAVARGGSGLYSTANDYVKMLVSLINCDDKILKAESIKELFKPQLDDPKHFQDFCDGPFHDSICPEFPRMLPVNYALGGAVNQEDVPEKRRTGSMMWSGVTGPRWVNS